MGSWVPRLVPWALVGLVLAGALASISGARAGSPTNYTLLGNVEQNASAGFAPVPAGVTVQLTSQATRAVYSTTTTVASGAFNFNSTGTGGALGVGWWGLQVPPQVAHLTAFGCTPCVVLPENQNPRWVFENQSDLTKTTYPVTIQNVSYLPLNATLFGNVTQGTQRVQGATVQLLAPAYAGFVVNSTTSNKTGSFQLTVPWGSWVLTATLPGFPSKFSYNTLTVNAPVVRLSPAITAYVTSGYINVNTGPSFPHVPNGGNVTVVDLANHYLYTAPTPAGGFYSFGTYPAGFNYVTGGLNTFTAIFSPVGYNTTWYTYTVSSANPTGSSPRNVLVQSVAPPGSYSTTLNFSTGFGKVNVTTSAQLGPNAVLDELPNASVGDLWSQLALDVQHNLTFLGSNVPWLSTWLKNEGPFFGAGQAGLTVNSTGFGQPTNGTFTFASSCATVCGLASPATAGFHWYQNYNVTAKIPTNSRTYAMSFGFRHPTHAESINYTVVLPSGFALSANTPNPAGALLTGSGPNGTWTKFTLVAKPYSSPGGTASLTLVKFGNLTANVNVSVSNFTFSHLNVLNSTRGNYTAVVGVGENVTFSGVNSTFSSGTNGSLYKWVFGASIPSKSSAQPTTYYTYNKTGQYAGKLTVIGSGGTTNSTAFTIYVGNTAPTAVITDNLTKSYASGTAGGVPYVVVNWSTGIQFNASKSTSTLYSGAPVKGVISVALWNISSYKFYPKVANFSASSGQNPLNNFSSAFLGAGHYLVNTTLNGVAVAFTGWQYNITLTIWDGTGLSGSAKMFVLVRDTEKPTAVPGLLSSKGIATTSLQEGANHTAFLYLAGGNSTDPHNGSIVKYLWKITNSGNSSVNLTYTQVAKPSAYSYPGKLGIWLTPQGKAYTVNLTVTDRAGNSNYATAALTVGINSSTRPVMSATNLTAPGTMTGGTSYTIWVNVTNTIGQNSTAQGVQVTFYLLPPGGSGAPILIGGSPGSVRFYNYTSGVVNSATTAVGTATMKYNTTLRAEISFNPSRTGSWWLYANVTATNEFQGSYGPNLVHIPVTLNQNPLVLDEEYGIIAGAVIIFIAAVVIFYRRRSSRGSAKASGSSRSGLLRGGKKDEDKDDDEES
ncbi:MAG TPA: PKD domain-containing protein [Thermoplasmata archaeon]|nr:PKD domain-containing protein [Thermoplasmata archaeon]